MRLGSVFRAQRSSLNLALASEGAKWCDTGFYCGVCCSSHSLQARKVPPKFEVGAQFRALHLSDVKENTFGAGIRFVYNPVRYFSVDSELNCTFSKWRSRPCEAC